MGKVALSALVGAIVGGVILVLVAKMGGPAVIQVGTAASVPQAVNLDGIVFKLALLLGVSTGALVGALAGVAANRAS